MNLTCVGMLKFFHHCARYNLRQDALTEMDRQYFGGDGPMSVDGPSAGRMKSAKEAGTDSKGIETDSLSLMLNSV